MNCGRTYLFLFIFEIIASFQGIADSLAYDTEAAIMANFEFLSHEGDVDMDEDDDDEEMNDVIEEGSKVFNTARKFKVSVPW